MRHSVVKCLLALGILLVPGILLFGQNEEAALLLSQNRQGVLSLVAFGSY